MKVELEQQCQFKIPENLYVPTPPLWIESQEFQGPLDLLWYLIREQNIDILDIPVALITSQYLEYLQCMDAQCFELAPDYLLMAVRLLQIKSQILLAKPPESDAEDADPRAALVAQLRDYENIQNVAQWLDHLPQWYRDCWPIKLVAPCEFMTQVQVDVSLDVLVHAYQLLQKKQQHKKTLEIPLTVVNLSDKMQEIYMGLEYAKPVYFYQILSHRSSSLDVAVSFQAILELAKNRQIVVEQEQWDDVLSVLRITK